MPGVSTKTICPSGRVTMPLMRVRVVCGLAETAAMCSPTSAFSRVDLPALGRPMRAAKPDLCPDSLISEFAIPLAVGAHGGDRFSHFNFLIGRGNWFLNSHPRDAAFVGFDHFEAQPVEFNTLAHRRQV